MKIRSRTRSLFMIAVLSLATLITPAVVSPSPAAAYPCSNSDRLEGGFYQLVHYMNCSHIPFTVVGSGGTATPESPAINPDSGGSSCTYLTAHTVKICTSHSGTVRQIVCARYYDGSYYPYHCGPTEAYNLTHAEGLWDGVKAIFVNHGTKACIRGILGGTVTGVIVKVAGAGGPIGIAAGAAGGCVGGIITFFWHI